MNVYLFDLNDDPRTLHKSIPAVLPAPVDGKLNGEIDIENPVLMIESALQNVNYAYIPDLQRYYYIDDIVQVRASLCELHMSVDVLQSFRTSIENAAVYAARTAKKKMPGGADYGYNPYLADPKQPVIVPTREDVIELGTFTWGTQVLVTMG